MEQVLQDLVEILRLSSIDLRLGMVSLVKLPPAIVISLIAIGGSLICEEIGKWQKEQRELASKN